MLLITTLLALDENNKTYRGEARHQRTSQPAACVVQPEDEV